MKKHSGFKLNNLSAVLLQLATVVSGILLPRIILKAFGSETNGLVSSVTQFLSYFSLMEAGVSSVTRAAMFEPLANNDNKALSRVVNSSQRYYRGIAVAFLGYLALVSIGYPFIAQKDGFDFGFVFSLVLILGIGTLTTYFFGLTYQILLQADQKLYIANGLQIVAILLNLLFSVGLVALGAGIHMVKLLSAVALLIRPVGIYLYVRKRYALDRKIKPEGNILKQRWDGLSHHLAFFVQKNTGVTLLTFFSSFSEISVYALHNMIASNIQGVVSLFSASFTSKFGQLYAKKDEQKLTKAFSRYETFIFLISACLFSVTSILIVPFIKVYTTGVNDADYERPLFAMLLVFSEYLYALRIPYNNLVFGVGELRNTRNGAIIEAICNVVVSLLLVGQLGIVGVAIGAVVAVAYRVVDYALFLSKNVLNRPIKFFVKNMGLSLLGYLLPILACELCLLNRFEIANMGQWFLWAIIVMIICCAINAGLQFVLNKKAFLSAFKVFED